MEAFQSQSSTRSMLFGGALATAVLLGIGALQQNNPSTLRVINDPHPDFVIRVTEGTPYTVPAGSMLSVKSLGATRPSTFSSVGPIILKINGADVLTGTATTSPAELSMPVVANPGDIITVEDEHSDPAIHAVALGYLTRI